MTSLPDKLRALAAFDDNRARFDMPRRYEHIDRPDLWSMAEEKAYRRLTPLIEALVRVAGECADMCAEAERSKEMFEITSGASGMRMSFDYSRVDDALAELERLVEGEKLR